MLTDKDRDAVAKSLDRIQKLADELALDNCDTVKRMNVATNLLTRSPHRQGHSQWHSFGVDGGALTERLLEVLAPPSPQR